MNTNVIKSSSIRRAPRLYKLSPTKAVCFTLEFGLFLLFCSSKDYGYALATGLLVGLTLSKQNLAVISPLYFIAGAVFFESWWTMLFYAVPPVLLAVLCLVFFKLKRNVMTSVGVATALVSIVPYIVINALEGDSPLRLAVCAAVVVIFSLCCITAGFAVFIRGLKCRYTLDEKISGGVFLIAFAYSLYAANVYGFRLYYLVVPAVIVYCSDRRSPSETLTAALLSGLGAAAFSLDLGVLAATVLWGGAALALSSFTRFASAGGIAVVEALLWLVSGYAASSWRGLVLLAAGVIGYCALPSSIRIRLPSCDGAGKAAALSFLVNRSREELAGKLSSIAAVFGEMSEELALSEDSRGRYSPRRLASEIAKSYCGRCPEREKCFSAMGGDTSFVLEQPASAALSRGKATILDTPTFITSHCGKVNNLLSVVNNAAEAYRSKLECSKENLRSKRLLSEQFAGVSLVLDAMATDSGRHLSFGSEREAALENELLRHNIVARDTVITEDEDGFSVSLTVRDSDANKAVLPKIASKCLRTRLSVADRYQRGEEKTLRLEPSPLFETAYGVAEKTREGEEDSGDVKAVLTPSKSKRVFAICDGMGGGSAAKTAAEHALNMISGFYKAGFEDSLVLTLVNKLLCLSGGEVFSTVDAAVIDTFSGGLDVIKLGAASGFLIRRDSIEVINSSSLPVGIIDSAEPVTARYQLYDGDMLLVASDGVVDVLGEQGVIRSVERLNTLNPQTLADELLSDAKDAGSEDDCTVMCVRLIAV